MTDPITRVAPAEETITPQPQTSAQPPSSTPEAAPETQPEEPKYVTPESLKVFGDTLVKRITQSSRDREKAIKKEVGELRASLQAAGITPTAEQEAKLRETVEQKYEEPEEPEETHVTPVAAEQADKFLAKQLSIVFGKAGATVTKDDPEFAGLQKAIDDNFTNPDGLPDIILAAHQAATAKAARLQNQSQTAAARVVGRGGSGGSDFEAKTARLEELQKHPSQNRSEIRKLKEELDARNWS